MKKTGISENKKYMEFTTAKINDQLEEMKLINKNLENIYNALKEKE